MLEGHIIVPRFVIVRVTTRSRRICSGLLLGSGLLGWTALLLVATTIGTTTKQLKLTTGSHLDFSGVDILAFLVLPLTSFLLTFHVNRVALLCVVGSNFSHSSEDDNTVPVGLLNLLPIFGVAVVSCDAQRNNGISTLGVAHFRILSDATQDCYFIDAPHFRSPLLRG